MEIQLNTFHTDNMEKLRQRQNNYEKKTNFAILMIDNALKQLYGISILLFNFQLNFYYNVKYTTKDPQTKIVIYFFDFIS